MNPERSVHRSPGIPVENIDPDALQVVRRLSGAGSPSLFVGGCVRDLLLGRRPKDFDVVTPLSLRRVRRIFRSNSRVIGRRHRLVHVFFDDGKVIEVSTYPKPDDGSSESPLETEWRDACRRDFTVNALYYDPIEDRLIDYVGGFEDIRTRVLRSIGPPRENFLEDCVRIVRGIRYACLLDFTIEEKTWEAMVDLAHTMAGANKRRMQEELWKFLMVRGTDRAFRVFADLGIFVILFPELAGFLDPEGPSRLWKYLAAKDEIPAESLTHTLAISTLFLPLLDEIEALGLGDVESELSVLGDRCHETVAPIGRTYSLAKKVRYGVIQHLNTQLALIRGPDSPAQQWIDSADLASSFRLFRVLCRGRGWDLSRAEAWEGQADRLIREGGRPERPARRRRRRRRKRRSG